MSNPILDILVPKVYAQPNPGEDPVDDGNAFFNQFSAGEQTALDSLVNNLSGTVDIAGVEANCISKEAGSTSESTQVKICKLEALRDLQQISDQCNADNASAGIDEIAQCIQEGQQGFCSEKPGSAYISGKCVCPSGETKDGQCLANNYGTLGINCSTTELIRGNCSLNVSQLLGIREEQAGTNTVLNLLQDVTLGATSFIGTVLTIGMVIVGLKYIFGGLDEAFVSTAKKGFKYGIIGFFLVIFAYTIVRMIQYLATG